MESGFVDFLSDEKRLVLTTPGSIIMVLIPKGASSYLIDSLRPSSANFELMYAGVTGNPILPATELMFTMIPDFWLRIVGKTCCIVLTIPKKLVSNWAFISFMVMSSKHPTRKYPALFTSTSTLFLSLIILFVQ